MEEVGVGRCGWRCVFAEQRSCRTAVGYIRDSELRGIFHHLIEILAPLTESDMSAGQCGLELVGNLCDCRIEPNRRGTECVDLCRQQCNQKISSAVIVDFANLI